MPKKVPELLHIIGQDYKAILNFNTIEKIDQLIRKILDIGKGAA
jgi:hypothetical protein